MTEPLDGRVAVGAHPIAGHLFDLPVRAITRFQGGHPCGRLGRITGIRGIDERINGAGTGCPIGQRAEKTAGGVKSLRPQVVIKVRIAFWRA